MDSTMNGRPIRLGRACSPPIMTPSANARTERHDANDPVANPCTGYLGHPFSHLAFRASLNEPSCQSVQPKSTITTVQNALTFCRSVYFDKGEIQLAFRLVITIKQRVGLSFHALQKRFLCWVKPPTTSLVLGTLADLARGKSELIVENALLRQQLIILHRQIKRPVYRKTDRLLLVFLTRMVRTWKQALFLVQPETLLRWHRELFRVFWNHKSPARSKKLGLSPETITLIQQMAANNRLWGAERIRGELLKLDIRVSKRTIQKYMKQVRPKRASGQTWKTFLRNHTAEVSGWGPVISCRSLISSFVRCLPSSSFVNRCPK